MTRCENYYLFGFEVGTNLMFGTVTHAGSSLSPPWPIFIYIFMHVYIHSSDGRVVTSFSMSYFLHIIVLLSKIQNTKLAPKTSLY